MHKRSYYELVDLARDNRKHLSYIENQLKNKLNRKQYPFVCQYVIPPYIVDFYFPTFTLAVELDGIQHQSHKKYDEIRDNVLLELGIYTLRIKAKEFIKNPEHYIKLIEGFQPQLNYGEVTKKIKALRKLRMTDEDKKYCRRKKEGGVVSVGLPNRPIETNRVIKYIKS